MGMTPFLMIMAAVALEICGQVAFKRGAARVAHGEDRVLAYWRRMANDAWVQLGIALHVFELLLWIAALRLAPLTIAFPLMALSYCGTAVAGHYWLQERLGTRGRIAIALITVGAFLVTWPGG
jgi:undecaprenyl phosphate-alpha-L-ara4N flippase subunit ArnE